MKFNELNLMEPVLETLAELQYKEPSPIQEKAIPLLLKGKDVIACAQTGSGKTAAFALPILEKVDGEKKQIQAVIMTPTRELAIQISDSIKQYSKRLTIKTGAIFGGVDQTEQVAMLTAGIQILVATPGRMLDLMRQGFINLNGVKIFVLDEADRMLDMGFVDDIKTITEELPKTRQTVMFSATMPKPIERLADAILNQPVTVKQDVVTRTVDTVHQQVYYIDEENKLNLLTQILKSGDVKNAIVFTNTKHCAETVMRHLMKVAIRSRAIHSDKSQNSRQDALLQFKNGKIKVLVATDVAARGIDISQLSHVINYEIPDNADTYIHRVGRTGRAGTEGIAINLCCYDEMYTLKNIEGYTGIIMETVKSEWPMQVFKKKQELKNLAKKKKEEKEFDITKVKDISLNGKPKQKRKQFGYGRGRKTK